MTAQDYVDPEGPDTVDRYRERYKRFARSPESLGWRAGTQDARFASFFAGFSIASPASVLDVGCGFGDLLAFLRARGWQGNYVGIDIVPEFIEEARVRFADDAKAVFHCREFKATADIVGLDAAFASGVLNHKRKNDHEGFVKHFLCEIAKCGGRYFAVDFLSTTADRRREDLFFHDPAWILSCGLIFSKRVQLDHSYMPYEFMLKIWRPDDYPADFPVFPSQ